MTGPNGGPIKPIPKLTEEHLKALALDMEKRETKLIEMEKVNAYSAVSITQKFTGNVEVEKIIHSEPRPASSIQFDMDSKGLVKPSVKIYHENPEIAFQLAVKYMADAKMEARKLSNPPE